MKVEKRGGGGLRWARRSLPAVLTHRVCPRATPLVQKSPRSPRSLREVIALNWGLLGPVPAQPITNLSLNMKELAANFIELIHREARIEDIRVQSLVELAQDLVLADLCMKQPSTSIVQPIECPAQLESNRRL